MASCHFGIMPSTATFTRMLTEVFRPFMPGTLDYLGIYMDESFIMDPPGPHRTPHGNRSHVLSTSGKSTLTSNCKGRVLPDRVGIFGDTRQKTGTNDRPSKSWHPRMAHNTENVKEVRSTLGILATTVHGSRISPKIANPHGLVGKGREFAWDSNL